jgi:hypothetical protein
MREGQGSFRTNRRCKKDKNDFRRRSNATRTRIISDVEALQEGQE